jgi:hypothetical protein
MQQGRCGYGFDPIGEFATGASLPRSPRLHPIGEAAFVDALPAARYPLGPRECRWFHRSVDWWHPERGRILGDFRALSSLGERRA